MASLPIRPFIPRSESPSLGALLSVTERLAPQVEMVRPVPGGPPPLPTPQMIDWTQGVTDWGTLGNTIAGNCTVAAMGHLIAAWTDAVGERDTTTSDEALAVYSQLTGYSRATGANDTGLSVETIMRYWSQTGSLFGHSIQGSLIAMKIQAFQVGWLKAAIAQYGGAVLVIELSDRAITAFNQGQTWDGHMGSISGYHSVTAISYDDDVCEVVTWGRLQRVSWSFLSNYLVELWCILGSDWISGATTPLNVSSQQTRDSFNRWGIALAR